MIEHFVLLSVVSCVQFLAPKNQNHGLYHLPYLPVTYLRAEHPGETCRVDRLNDGDVERKGDATECEVRPHDSLRWYLREIVHPVIGTSKADCSKSSLLLGIPVKLIQR